MKTFDVKFRTHWLIWGDTRKKKTRLGILAETALQRHGQWKLFAQNYWRDYLHIFRNLMIFPVTHFCFSVQKTIKKEADRYRASNSSSKDKLITISKFRYIDLKSVQENFSSLKIIFCN